MAEKTLAKKPSIVYEKIILYPYMTEKVVRMGPANKIAFVVARSAGKRLIKEAVEALYEVKVAAVNTEIDPKGMKKAYVKLTPEFSATELASKLGML